MIARSEYGPRCPHCGHINPAIALDASAACCTCIVCRKPFSFWIEKLPFYCTDNGRAPRCDCDLCMGKVAPAKEAEPSSG